MALDPRIVRVGVTINGILNVYEGLAITAQGSKYASATQNETTIKIANLSKDKRDFLATEGTPFNRIKDRRRQTVFLEAGRVSIGTTRMFTGDITLVNLSQPPDIWTVIKATTSDFQKGNIISTNEAAVSNLSSISQKAADALTVSMQFSATDKQIPNYGFTGAAAKQIEKIAELAGVDAFVDDEVLVVKDTNSPRPNITHIISASSGMIGKPDLTDFGIKVKVLFDARIQIGNEIEVVSEFYPASNGRYIVYKIDFDISNREQPFYYIVEGRRQGGVFNG